MFGRRFAALLSAMVSVSGVALVVAACSSDGENTTEIVLNDSGSADSQRTDAEVDDGGPTDTGADTEPTVPPYIDAGVGIVASFNGVPFAFNIATKASHNPSTKSYRLEGRTQTTPYRAVQFEIIVNDAGAITCTDLNTVTAVVGEATYQANKNTGACSINITNWPSSVGQPLTGTFGATAPEVGGAGTLQITDGQFEVAWTNDVD